MSKFWKPGTVAPGVNVEREDGKESGAAGGGDDVVVFNPHENLTIAKQRRMLPIFQNRLQLLHCVERYQCTVIVGQTGCGKTTRTFVSSLQY